MEITVKKTRPARVPLQKLTALGERLLVSEGWPADVEVDLWLCSDAEIHALNRQYRAKDQPTDVLSFPQYAPGDKPQPGLPLHLGDVVISVDTATRQARERGVSPGYEITWLWLHSLLHLIGYDDDSDEALETMVSKARVALGI